MQKYRHTTAIRIERTYVRCRACGVTFHHPDRAPGLEGKTAAPGAESLYADVASSESCGQASRKLKNLSGVEVSASTLQCHVAGIGGEIQAFEREDAEVPLVESGRQRRARHQMLPRKQALARLPRLGGLQRRSSLTQENGMHPVLTPCNATSSAFVKVGGGNAIS